MKSLILASAILLAVIASTTFGAIFTDKKLEELTDCIESAISDGEENASEAYSGAKAIEEQYQTIRKYLILFVHDDGVREIEEHIEDIKSAAMTDELPDAITSKNRLILHIEQLRRLSKFSPEAIF